VAVAFDPAVAARHEHPAVLAVQHSVTLEGDHAPHHGQVGLIGRPGADIDVWRASRRENERNMKPAAGGALTHHMATTSPRRTSYFLTTPLSSRTTSWSLPPPLIVG